MKLVFTVERYRPFIGGAELVTQRVAEGLSRRGHEVIVVTTGRRSTEELDGVRVERFRGAGNGMRGLRGQAGDAVDLIRALRPDVLLNYAAQTWPTDVCLPLLDDPDRPAMVLAPCGFSALGLPRWAGYFARLRERLPLYDALIFHSARYRDWDFAVAAGAEHRHVIPNGADPAVASRRPPARLAPGQRLLVTVSNHYRIKGHATFARTVRELRDSHEVRGVIVAPPRRGLEALRGCHPHCRLRHALPGSGVDLLDGRHRETVLGVIASADALLLPSTVECSPLVILEAMAASVPWVSYDVGNVRELAGGLIADGPEELVRLTGEVLSGRHPGLGAAGAQAWRRQHQWDGIRDRYEAVLEDALHARRRSRERAQSLAARRA